MSEIPMKMCEKSHKTKGDSYSLKDHWPFYFIRSEKIITQFLFEEQSMWDALDYDP